MILEGEKKDHHNFPLLLLTTVVIPKTLANR